MPQMPQVLTAYGAVAPTNDCNLASGELRELDMFENVHEFATDNLAFL